MRRPITLSEVNDADFAAWIFDQWRTSYGFGGPPWREQPFETQDGWRRFADEMRKLIIEHRADAERIVEVPVKVQLKLEEIMEFLTDKMGPVSSRKSVVPRSTFWRGNRYRKSANVFIVNGLHYSHARLEGAKAYLHPDHDDRTPKRFAAMHYQPDEAYARVNPTTFAHTMVVFETSIPTDGIDLVIPE